MGVIWIRSTWICRHIEKNSRAILHWTLPVQDRFFIQWYRIQDSRIFWESTVQPLWKEEGIDLKETRQSFGFHAHCILVCIQWDMRCLWELNNGAISNWMWMRMELYDFFVVLTIITYLPDDSRLKRYILKNKHVLSPAAAYVVPSNEYGHLSPTRIFGPKKCSCIVRAWLSFCNSQGHRLWWKQFACFKQWQRWTSNCEKEDEDTVPHAHRNPRRNAHL